MKRRHAESGFTLVELLITISIMSILFVALFAGLITFFKAAVVQRSTANLDQVVRTYAEQLGSSAYNSSCPASYASITVPSGYSVTSGPTVTYWNNNNPATFVASCPGGTDSGIQQITVQVRNDVSGQRQTFVVVKRKLA